MVFNVTFDDGTIDMPYAADPAQATQFQDYVDTIPELYPLRFTAKVAKFEVAKLNRLAITHLSQGATFYLSLRYFDGANAAWYDSLGLPDHSKAYVLEARLVTWIRKGQRAFKALVHVLGKTFPINGYEARLYASRLDYDPLTMQTITAEDRQRFPAIWEL
jgi:hypothetical protein